MKLNRQISDSTTYKEELHGLYGEEKLLVRILFCVTFFTFLFNPALTFSQNRIVIGDGETDRWLISSNYPFQYAQFIYPAELIGSSGTIESISFFRGVNRDLPGGMITTDTFELYLGITNKNSFSDLNDWISMDQLSLVFEGVATSLAHDSWFEIEIAPFYYNGMGNIILAKLQKREDNSMVYVSSSVYDFQNHLVLDTQYPIDIENLGSGNGMSQVAPDIMLSGDFERDTFLYVYPKRRTLAGSGGDTCRFNVFAGLDDLSVDSDASDWLSYSFQGEELEVISILSNPDPDNTRQGVLTIRSGGHEKEVVVVQEKEPSFELSELAFPEGYFGNANIGDLDSDGDLDVILSTWNRFDESMGESIRLLKNESGNIEDVDHNFTDIRGRGISLGDLNNDNELDLIFCGQHRQDGQPVTEVYFNQSGFNFMRAEMELVDLSRSYSAMGDLDNDGDQDMILMGVGKDEVPKTLLYWNLGNGNFADSEMDLEGLMDGAITIADLDNDYDNDFILNGTDIMGRRRTILMQNKTPGLFVETPCDIPSIGSGTFRAADLNEDAKTDLVMTAGWDNFESQGGSAFFYQDQPLEYSQYEFGFFDGIDFDMTDYNNDGWMDIATTGGVVLRNKSEWIYHHAFDIQVLDGNLQGGRWIDWDGDFKTDLLISNRGFGGGTYLWENITLKENAAPSVPNGLSSNVERHSVVLNWQRASDEESPDNSLSYNIRIGTTPGGNDIMSPMADQDGIRKLAGDGNCGFNTGWKLEGLEAGVYYWSVQAVDQSSRGSRFSEEASFIIKEDFLRISNGQIGDRNIHYISPMDFDNDSDYDFFIAEYVNQGSYSELQLHILENSGGYVFKPIRIEGISSDFVLNTCCVEDFDKDGFLDIVVSLFSGDYTVFETILLVNNKGNGFTSDHQISEVSPGIIHSSDFDNDGDLDLLFADYESDNRSGNADREFHIYENLGMGGFKQSSGIGGLDNSSSVYVFCADFNTDGRTDVFVSNGLNFNSQLNYNYVNRIFLNGPDGFSLSDGLALPKMKVVQADLADLDKDQDPDIAIFGISDSWYKGINVYQNVAGTGFQNLIAELQGIDEDGTIEWMDFNLDGNSDLLTVNKYLRDGRSTLYLNSDFGGFNETELSYNGGIDNWYAWWADSGRKYWIDMDADLDLDLVVPGYANDGVLVNMIWENQNTFEASSPPAPQNLSHDNQGYGIKLNWDSPAREAESYNLRIGTTPGGAEVVRPGSDLSTGFLRIPKIGNAGFNEFFCIDSLPEGEYFWSVQAVNRNKLGGSWSPEQSFEIESVNVDFIADTVCLGSPTTFIDRSIVRDMQIEKWDWEFNGVHSTDQNPVYVFQSPGSHEVYLSVTSGGESFHRTKRVFVKPGPQADFDVEDVCHGEFLILQNQTDLNGTIIDSWYWDFGDEITSYEFQPQPHGYIKPGVYNIALVANSDNGCTDTISKIVNINDVPQKSIASTGAPCQGGDYLLSTVDNSSYSYQWLYEGTKIPGANESVFHPTQSGEYTVIVRSQCGDVSASYYVGFLPELPKPDLFVRGPEVWYLACSDTTADEYRWYRDGQLIEGATGPMYVPEVNNGMYEVKISNEGGCFTASDPVYLPGSMTGIQKDPFQGLKIYPNPSPGIFSLEMDNALMGDLLIDIFTEQGAKVLNIKFHKETSHFKTEIDLRAQPAGAYVIGLTLHPHRTERILVVE